MRRVAPVVAAAALAVSGCGGSTSSTATSTTTPSPVAGCSSAHVHYSPYPGHGKGLSGLPWICGAPESHGLVGLLWYWPQPWQERRLAEPRIFTGGEAPAGGATKILWAFLADSAHNRGAKELTVRGRRLNGPGTIHQRFAAISYIGQAGAPSYASVIEIPRPGPWRLQLSTGELHGTVDLRAVPG